ncbi:MAG: CDP-alcohol phosphatidyltransferase family protein [Candidatus Eisenbacteria bacterium]|jgi:CDP-diacylglycerol--glycerol-3-phosphate 3-phosphatidyltransferase|nr:CDP-alcohol phosphatidyltransferase family protein [Candidatus Eisenbacteria bacterium]
MAANLITLGRILLAFVVVAMFQGGFALRMAAVALTVLVIWLDSLDGYVARKLGAASEVGALFDITGDRIVEHIYLIFYAAVGVVSFWVPLIFVTRSFLVDTLRTVAFSKEGRTPFGDKTMMRSPFTRFLTSSRFSRAVYGVLKVVVFVLLGLCLAFRQARADGATWLAPPFHQAFARVTVVLVWIMVAFNLFRGLPVLYDGRTYLFDKYLPRQLKRDA